MAHGIAGNRAAFTGDIDDVWHRLGTYVGDKEVTGAEIITLAGANFHVREEVLYLPRKDGTFGKAPFGIALVRDPWPDYVDAGENVHEDPNQPVQLGLIRGGRRKRYVVRQNIETATFFDEFVAAKLLKYTSCAVLKRGVAFFVAAEMVQDTVRRNPDGSEDVVKGYATLYNRHDGESSSQANFSGIRVVCFNTLMSALASGLTARIPHSGLMKVRFEDAKKELEQGSKQFAGLMDNLRRINAVKATDSRVNRLFEVTFPITKEADQEKEYSKRRLAQIAQITKLMMHGTGNGGGTVYDWFNGLTQWLDHDDDGEGAVTESAFISSNYGSKAQTRQRAFDAALDMAS